MVAVEVRRLLLLCWFVDIVTELSFLIIDGTVIDAVLAV